MLDETFTPHGKHLIAGDWVAGEDSFQSEPAHGPAHDFSTGTPALVDAACVAAEEAFSSFGYSRREDRAAFLNAIAEEIEARAERSPLSAARKPGCPRRGFKVSAGAPWDSCGSLPSISSRGITSTVAMTRRCPNARPCRVPTCG